MRLHPGEVEGSGWRVVPLGEAVRFLLGQTPAVGGRPRVVAVDGRGGAGKTTLVERLSKVVPRSAVMHTDDVAWNFACFDWGELLCEAVLRPLHRGDAVEFRPDAWVAHGRGGAIVVPAGLDVVWVEGTGVIRDELAPWLDASVWVQGDLDEQTRRLLVRDGDSPEQAAQVASWMVEELPLLLREQPWSRATIIVAGSSPIEHDPDTEVVVAPPART